MQPFSILHIVHLCFSNMSCLFCCQLEVSKKASTHVDNWQDLASSLTGILVLKEKGFFYKNCQCFLSYLYFDFFLILYSNKCCLP